MNYNLKRILFAFALGVFTAAIMTEVAYFFLQKENREPSTVELIIPAGTAQLIDQGQTLPTLPNDMRFVVGDTLQVINQDSTNHQLGPLYIPANSSASLKLDAEENSIVECSFQASNYLGITVQEPVTWWTRIKGYFFSGFPLGMLFAVYSGLITTKKKENEPAS
jgi:hypothetical protein